MKPTFHIESLLSARLFMNPQLTGDRLFFLSNLSGKLSLYAMDKSGSVPEPLLPPDIALQNPTLMAGESFVVLPDLQKILVMIDHDGDENYQPCLIPIDGGVPERAFGDRFQGQQVHCSKCDATRKIAFFQVDPRRDPLLRTFKADLTNCTLEELGSSLYGNWVGGANEDYSKVLLIDSYTAGDNVLYLWEHGAKERTLLYGKPIEQRSPDEQVPLNSISACHFTENDKAILFMTSLFEDAYGLATLRLDKPEDAKPVRIEGTTHRGTGELTDLKKLMGNRFLLKYNIDGCSYGYEATYDETSLCMKVDRAICGRGALRQGVLQSIRYDKQRGDYALAFSTATSPAQIYTVAGKSHRVVARTRERILGIAQELLAPGEDASFTSHDGLRISARLYLPSKQLNYAGPRPVIFYIHGGPQSQERPDFTWFSMPLIQFLTLNGFAVFAPNVRGSTGYGLKYMKHVDRDWGGQDRLDHVHAFNMLMQDERLDMKRVAVMGRSYGGFMTLTLLGRHPEFWRAGCDMFGPYNMFTFLERMPEAWKTYFHLAVGHPEGDKDLLIDRSPKTHLHKLACPLLVIQGKNDPRVREAESRDLVEELKAQGKRVEYLVFENEGHDVIKYENRVKCYNEIVRFFAEHLGG